MGGMRQRPRLRAHVAALVAQVAAPVAVIAPEAAISRIVVFEGMAGGAAGVEVQIIVHRRG